MPETISLRGHIGGNVRAEDIKRALDKAGGKPIRIEVNSPGGFVFEGLDIFNLIRDYKGHTTTVLMSLAASMGSYILLAGDRMIAHDNAVFMIHNAVGGVHGNHNHMRKAADTIEGLTNMLALQYVKRTGRSLAEIKNMLDKETFLFGKEILEEGFVDEIIEAPEDADDDDHPKDKATAVMHARANIEKCVSFMKENESANQDFEKAVALLDLHDPKARESITEFGFTWTPEESESAEAFDPESPFPNEHACRIRQPGDFQKDSFRSITRKADGKDLDIIIGRLKGKTTTTTQAFRYPKGQWTVDQARKHCTGHNGLSFEPAEAGHKQEEGNNMSKLTELLAADHTAKAEHDAAIAAATKLGREEEAKALQELVAKVSPVYSSGYYPAPIKSLAEAVLKGETDKSALEAAVASFDSTKEGQDLKAAFEEQKKLGETPPEPQKQGGQDDGSIESEDDYQATISHMKGEKKEGS